MNWDCMDGGHGALVGRVHTPDGWVDVYARSGAELASWMHCPGFKRSRW